MGWRIGDVLNLKKDDIPDLKQTPIPFNLVTEKEKVLSETFLSAETVELLKTYLPTIEGKTNPYLFPSNGKGSLRGEAINYKLREACKKANIKIPKGKRLRFHGFRKRFLSTCANLKIDVNIAKILVGKAVKGSMREYLSGIDRKSAFIEVREETLSLSNGTVKNAMQTKDRQIQRLEKELEKLRLTMQGMTEIFGEQILEKAIAKLREDEGYSIVTITPQPHDTTTTTKLRPSSETGLKSAMEILEELGRLKQKKQEEEYKRLIENGNGNNNHS